MGGEGSMMAANQSLKANRAQLRRKERGKFSLVSNSGEKFVDHKKASPELLEEIRERLQERRKRKFRIRLICVTIALIVFLSLCILIDWDFLFTPGYSIN